MILSQSSASPSHPEAWPATSTRKLADNPGAPREPKGTGQGPEKNPSSSLTALCAVSSRVHPSSKSKACSCLRPSQSTGLSNPSPQSSSLHPSLPVLTTGSVCSTSPIKDRPLQSDHGSSWQGPRLLLTSCSNHILREEAGWKFRVLAYTCTYHAHSQALKVSLEHRSGSEIQ